MRQNCEQRRAIKDLNQMPACANTLDRVAMSNGQVQENELKLQVQEDEEDSDDDTFFNDEYTVATASTQSTEAKNIAHWEPQDKDSIVQVQTDAEDDINIGIYPDEVVVTHKVALTTLDHTYLIYYGDQNITLPQDA